MAYKAEINFQFKDLPANKYLYFASDFHLGAPNEVASLERERKIIRWLDSIKGDAAGILLVGDIFDFWFEYGKVIPKGFQRFQSKLRELVDKEIPVFFFTGNHDAWYFDYFPVEYGIPIHRRPITLEVGHQTIFVGHGDGLGPGDQFYKLLKKIFESRVAQGLFRWIHPDIGMALAHKWSRNSRITSTKKDDGFRSNEHEWLWQFARSIQVTTHHDFYIFGHRHLPLDLEVDDNSRYLNLGEWVNHCTYVKYDGKKAELLSFIG